jgi:hypothetical protein
MNAAFISGLVAQELANYRYEAPAPGTTLGVPWPEAKILEHLKQLRASLVEPYLQRFTLRGSVEEINSVSLLSAEYWVVAVTSAYIEFYDQDNREFGLAEMGRNGKDPVTVGVRGDLVGVFCAM